MEVILIHTDLVGFLNLILWYGDGSEPMIRNRGARRHGASPNVKGPSQAVSSSLIYNRLFNYIHKYLKRESALAHLHVHVPFQFFI